MTEAAAEVVYPSTPVLDSAAAGPECEAQPRPQLGAEVHRFERALAPLMGALRGLMFEADPELREFYEGHLDVQRYDAVVVNGMGNGFFRALCLEGQRRLREEYGRQTKRAD